MHPLGMFFAITNGEREQGWADEDERALSRARAEAGAKARVRQEPARRTGRLAGILRRRLLGTARA